MPISGGKYVAPTWVDNAPPALGATELQAISDSVASYADPVAQIPWFTRPNLLDNWYFVGGGSQQGGNQFPVNSLGQTSSYNSGGGSVYFIDRWLNRSSNHTMLSVESSGLKIKVMTAAGTNKNQFINQRIENSADLLGKTVTISMLVPDASFATGGFGLYVYAADSVLYNTTSLGGTGNKTAPGFYTATFTIPATISKSGLTVGFNINQASSIDDYVVVSACKLELGSTQTLAHQENGSWVLNEIPNFDEQYMRCAILPGVPTRIEHGSYTGTGTYGSGNPSSLTFGFVPKTIIIYEDGIHVQNIEAIYGSQYVRVTYSTTNTATPTWDGSTTFKWYASGASNQMNSSGVSYYYVAIG